MDGFMGGGAKGNNPLKTNNFVFFFLSIFFTTKVIKHVEVTQKVSLPLQKQNLPLIKKYPPPQ